MIAAREALTAAQLSGDRNTIREARRALQIARMIARANATAASLKGTQ